jgi:hypothetical protein
VSRPKERLVGIALFVGLVVVLWCALSVLFGLASARFLRAVSRDEMPARQLADDLPDERAAHDDALMRDNARFADDTISEPSDRMSRMRRARSKTGGSRR